jgi:protein-tyrosine phosphatase
VPAAGLRHGLQQQLIEVVADPERGRGHTPPTQLGRVVGQLVAVGDAVVGKEDSELEKCRVTDITGVLPTHDVELERFPIEDPRTPTDGAAFREIIAGLLQRVRQGAFLAIACRGGLDRSGLAAACLLREAGLDADSAIERVHAARKRTLTIQEQQAFVRAWPPRE